MMDLAQRAVMLKGTREVRDQTQWPVASLEVREGTDGTTGLHGEASVVDHPYVVRDAFGEFTETIRAGAWDKTLREGADVVLLTNHTGLALARSSVPAGPGSLRLGVNPNLWWDATLNNSRSDANDVAAAVRDGSAPNASFAFRVTRQEWNEDYTEREITEVNMQGGDVSVVNFGANPAAFSAARCLRSLDGQDIEELDAALEALRAGTATGIQHDLCARMVATVGVWLNVECDEADDMTDPLADPNADVPPGIYDDLLNLSAKFPDLLPL